MRWYMGNYIESLYREGKNTPALDQVLRTHLKVDPDLPANELSKHIKVALKM